jgi:hypothetical protein
VVSEIHGPCASTRRCSTRTGHARGAATYPCSRGRAGGAPGGSDAPG